MSVRVNRETNELVEDRTLRRSGGSTVITLPPDLLAQAGMAADDDVEVAVSFNGDGEIVIRRKDDDA